VDSSWVDLIALHATRVVTVTEVAADAPDFAVFDGEKNERSEEEQETEESIANKAHPPSTAFSCPRDFINSQPCIYSRPETGPSFDGVCDLDDDRR
jgi:hypothetical protein